MRDEKPGKLRCTVPPTGQAHLVRLTALLEQTLAQAKETLECGTRVLDPVLMEVLIRAVQERIIGLHVLLHLDGVRRTDVQRIRIQARLQTVFEVYEPRTALHPV